jgi:hypothetical protein
MARIDDARAQLVAGQAERLRNDARKASELLRLGKIAEARELLEINAQYAHTIWFELAMLTRPPREPVARETLPSRMGRSGTAVLYSTFTCPERSPMADD